MGEMISAGSRGCLPFNALSLFDKPGVHKRCAEIYAECELRPDRIIRALPYKMQGEKIRIGYFSADFHDHATMYLLAEVLELHDRNRFEIFGFSLGPDNDDSMRRRAEMGMDKFVDI